MSLLGWIILIVGELGMFIYGIREGWSERKISLMSIVVAIPLAYICFVVSPGDNSSRGGGGFSNSNVEKIVKYELITNSNYDNIHVLSVQKGHQEDDYVTYKWEAEFRHLGALCRQTGFIKLYRNGDVKDFVKFNDIHVVK